MKKLTLVAGAVLGLSMLGVGAHAQSFIAYNLATPVNGNDSYPSALGLDFHVNTNITITDLGVFDAATSGTGAAHPLGGTLVVSLYNTDTQSVVAGLSGFTFTAASPGTLIGGNLFKAVNGGAGVAIGPGNYTIVASGFSGKDQNGNSLLSGFTADTYYSGNLITINTTQFRYNAAGNPGDSFPTGTLSGQLNAGTIRFNANTPEPGALAMLGGLSVTGAGMLLRRRRK